MPATERDKWIGKQMLRIFQESAAAAREALLEARPRWGIALDGLAPEDVDAIAEELRARMLGKNGPVADRLGIPVGSPMPGYGRVVVRRKADGLAGLEVLCSVVPWED